MRGTGYIMPVTTNIDFDEGTCSVGLLERAAEFFGLSVKQARATIREVADVTRTWQAVLSNSVAGVQSPLAWQVPSSTTTSVQHCGCDGTKEHV